MENEIDFAEDRFVIYEKLVKINFSFLAEDYGFRLFNIEKVDGHYISVRYLSKRVFVNLYYGSPSFELDFNIGRVGIEDKPNNEGFTSGDLIVLGDNKQWIGYKLYSAHSYENLHKCLPKLAALLKTCGGNCLKGDSSSYERMLLKKKRKINQWYDEQELKQTKKIASVAWKNKDYSKFIEVFKPVINALSPAEKKKLEYALKHLDN